MSTDIQNDIEVSSVTDLSVAVCVTETDPAPLQIPTNLPRGWIKSYFQANARLRSQLRFTRYELGPIKKDYIPPRFVTVADPEQPLLKARNRKGPNPHISAAKKW